MTNDTQNAAFKNHILRGILCNKNKNNLYKIILTSKKNFSWLDNVDIEFFKTDWLTDWVIHSLTTVTRLDTKGASYSYFIPQLTGMCLLGSNKCNLFKSHSFFFFFVQQIHIEVLIQYFLHLPYLKCLCYCGSTVDIG